MINGNITEFIDQLYYGQELVFIFKEKKYFIQGWWNDDHSQTTMVLSFAEEKDFDGYLWECRKERMDLCADAFLSASLWEGKTFLQIQQDVIWTDW